MKLGTILYGDLRSLREYHLEFNHFIEEFIMDSSLRI